MEEQQNIFVAVLIAWARVQPAVMGPKQCRKRGVGPVLRELREESSLAIVDAYAGGRRQAAQILSSHCRLCGLCRMARE